MRPSLLPTQTYVLPSIIAKLNWLTPHVDPIARNICAEQVWSCFCNICVSFHMAISWKATWTWQLCAASPGNKIMAEARLWYTWKHCGARLVFTLFTSTFVVVRRCHSSRIVFCHVFLWILRRTTPLVRRDSSFCNIRRFFHPGAWFDCIEMHF